MEEFHKDSSSKRGFAFYCKECAKKKGRDWYKANGRKPEQERESRLLREYGITSAEFTELLRSQKSKCQICSVPLVGGHQTHIDHDHKSKKIRGILCTNCNRGLGHFQDSILNLRNAIEYLTKA